MRFVAWIPKATVPYPTGLVQLGIARTRSVPGGSHAWLEKIGIRGQVLHTNGHGEQSISLLLDNGDAFIGDLAPENAIGDDDWKSKNSWALLRSKGAKHIKPAHANEYSLT